MAFHRSLGIRISVQGDGRIYKLTAKNDDGFNGIMYQVRRHSLSHSFYEPFLFSIELIG